MSNATNNNDLLSHIRSINEAGNKSVEGEENSFYLGYVEDLDHWAEYGVTTPEEFDLYNARVQYYDYHKDVHGFRPIWSQVQKMTLERLEEEMNYLGRLAEEEFKAEEAVQNRRQNEFEAEVNAMIKNGAEDRQTAIRWMIEANSDHFANFYGQDWMFTTCILDNLDWPRSVADEIKPFLDEMARKQMEAEVA
jgi:hypothetical protein